MISRRNLLKSSAVASAGAALGLNPLILQALQQETVRTRAIPSSGTQIPVIGLGGRWISMNSSAEELEDHRAVLHALAKDAEGAGRVFDSAASYGGGGSETYAGQWAREDGFADDIFWATKVNVAPRGGGSADPEAARAQIERSFERLGVPVLDLNQVHNVGDPATQLGILQEYKESGRIRHIGITTANKPQYGALIQAMHEYPVDFIGIDYAIDNTSAAEQILPLAQEKGIAVMVFLPFGRSRMWSRIGDRALPEWASEFDAHSWAQFMLKFVVAHEAVTVAVPGTGDAEHMVDNLGGGVGRLPTKDHLKQMIKLVESLPDG
jgi:aryl-alcohol dehydrogenase-like predicted oxidoreductase